jgi:ribonuclease HII
LLWGAGFTRVAGVDEVGMGPLAGPVVAAAVVLPLGTRLTGVADSKAMTRLARERMAERIRGCALGIGIGVIEADEIDRLNIYQAGLKAMRLAVEALPFVPDHVLVDARSIPELAVQQTRYAHGDAFVYSVAAASIVAKVHRDAVMRGYDAEFPQYGFGHHVGYATREHLAALVAHGPSRLHRLSFAPCRAARAARAPRVESGFATSVRSL